MLPLMFFPLLPLVGTLSSSYFCEREGRMFLILGNILASSLSAFLPDC